MLVFFKANVAALMASLFDFAVTTGAIYFFKVHVVTAAITGTVSGGLINFLIGRYWAFNAAGTSTRSQALKYLLVWTGNLLLNAGGMYFLTKLASLHYALAKLVVACCIAIAYNYPLQKNYVFKKNQMTNEPI
ncbi:GtrA family protein [Ferruginibacter profundus]